MEMDETRKRWYLIYCKPRQESAAQVNLGRQGYETHLPLAKVRKRRRGRWQDHIEPLFPRYLFIQLDSKTDNWSPIRSTLGVVNLVRFGLEPATIPDDLIQELLARANDEGLYELESLRNVNPGDPIRVCEGPMAGCEGIFVAKTSKDRVQVLLDIMGKQTRSHLPIESVKTNS